MRADFKLDLCDMICEYGYQEMAFITKFVELSYVLFAFVVPLFCVLLSFSCFHYHVQEFWIL